MAAEALAEAGPALDIQVYDAMPSVGRKFLLAGKGGLNLTHSEAPGQFNTRYGQAESTLAPMLATFDGTALREWAQALGVSTFVGSSGRVFPTDMKAAPLLRSWLQRLRQSGVQFSMRHRWTGWADDGALRFESPAGETRVTVDAVILALGGGSWAHLGSDGAWVPLLQAKGVAVKALQPSNCGFDAAGRTGSGWSAHFAERFAGQPFKSVAISCADHASPAAFSRRGEFVATATGVEGSLVYAASSLLRDQITAAGHAHFKLDLLPDKSHAQVLAQVQHPRGSRSLSSHLKSRLGLDGIKAGILHELLDKAALADPVRLAAAIKALPVELIRPRPLDEAISSAGGVLFTSLDAHLKLQSWQANVTGAAPVFCAGEMLDWEAPTGGYLLTACMASGRAAGQGALQHFGLAPAVAMPTSESWAMADANIKETP